MKLVKAYKDEAASLRARADKLRRQAHVAESAAGMLDSLARVRTSLAELVQAAEAWRPREIESKTNGN